MTSEVNFSETQVQFHVSVKSPQRDLDCNVNLKQTNQSKLEILD